MFYLIVFFGTLNVWRGCWLTFDVFVYPDYAVWKIWTAHFVSMFVLMIFLAGNSVISRGCFMDGDMSNGEGVLLPVQYVEPLMEAKRNWSRDTPDDPNASDTYEDKENKCYSANNNNL